MEVFCTHCLIGGFTIPHNHYYLIHYFMSLLDRSCHLNLTPPSPMIDLTENTFLNDNELVAPPTWDRTMSPPRTSALDHSDSSTDSSQEVAPAQTDQPPRSQEHQRRCNRPSHNLSKTLQALSVASSNSTNQTNIVRRLTPSLMTQTMDPSFRTKNWVFTAHQMQMDLSLLSPFVSYMIVGNEKTSIGGQHLQGYVQWKTRKSMNSCKTWLGRAIQASTPDEQQTLCQRIHVEPRKGTPWQATEYCMKEGDFNEIGTRPIKPRQMHINASLHRKRNTPSSASQEIVEDELQEVQHLVDTKGSDGVCAEHPLLYNKYMKYISAYAFISAERSNKKYLKETYEHKELRPHQQKWLDSLLSQTTSHGKRKVLWIWDEEGNTGKTWFSMWLLANFKKAQRFTNAKTSDIAYAIDSPNIVIFDFARTLDGFVNWNVIEQVKNGCIFSAKYKSRCKIFPPPCIVCLANFTPDRSKLSADRWDVIHHNPDPYA